MFHIRSGLDEDMSGDINGRFISFLPSGGSGLDIDRLLNKCLN